MSTSTSVQAFRDMDGEFRKMLDIKLYCDRQNVSYPQEVENYFRSNGSFPAEDAETLQEQLLSVGIEAALSEYSDESSAGYEIEVAKLPKEVKTLRFTNSW